MNFHSVHAEHVDAPYFEELPLTFECTLISYDEETGDLRGKIENTLADESILTNGKIDPEKLEPIAFDGVNHTYLLVKGVVADAFSCGKKFLK